MTQTLVAAVDLGSNSFHMLVAQAGDSGLQVIDRLREPVRLAEGLTSDKKLRPEVEERALACLQRFGQRLANLPRQQVRVVGTNTMRRLRQRGGFFRRAEKALGHPIEIISGVEEARLVFGGVTHGLSQEDGDNLVVDIGGGSTELIVGAACRPRLMESVHMGCVSHSLRFFPDGRLSERAMLRARVDAAAALKYLARRYRDHGWQTARGSSGSIRAVRKVGAALGLEEHRITRESLNQIYQRISEHKHIDDLDLPGLKEDRRPVFAGSVCVLAGVFDAMNIDTMEVSDRALREGVVYDLLGRLSHDDVRDQSVTALRERFQLDKEQADRVEQSLFQLYDQCADAWDLDKRLLRWAAQLHEIGLAISHAGYHKHSGYVLAAVDLHGFSRTEQQQLAAVVRNHRGRWDMDCIKDLRKGTRKQAKRMAILLRLAVILNRGRNPQRGVDVQIELKNKGLRLKFPPQWLQTHALTDADLEQEAERLRKTLGFKLECSD